MKPERIDRDRGFSFSKAKREWGVSDDVTFEAVWRQALALKRSADTEFVLRGGGDGQK